MLEFEKLLIKRLKRISPISVVCEVEFKKIFWLQVLMKLKIFVSLVKVLILSEKEFSKVLYTKNVFSRKQTKKKFSHKIFFSFFSASY